jgi:hypothetical protein
MSIVSSLSSERNKKYQCMYCLCSDCGMATFLPDMNSSSCSQNGDKYSRYPLAMLNEGVLKKIIVNTSVGT